MMAGTTPRRLKLAAVATGVMVAGVLAVPALASAQGVDEPSTTATTMDMPTTVTTVASTTTVTTVGSTTTSTLPSTTTTTRTPPQISQVADVYHPGDSITLSGKGCLTDGKPGTVQSVLVTEDGRVGLLAPTVPAAADGSFKLTVTLPDNVGAGAAALVPGCFPADGSEPFAIDGGIVFVVEIPGQPSGPITTNPGELKKKAIAKLAAPKAVTGKPTYTG
jgi:hypothetical protein